MGSEPESFGPINLIYRRGIAVVKINGPGKENVLNESMSSGLSNAMDSIACRENIKGVVIMSSKPNSFIAGADINMLEKVVSAEQGMMISKEAQKKFQMIEDSKIPIVAAIMGTCMGGGLELALACHYRLAVDTNRTVFSFPEVKLGLLPGAGGTQRLPQVVSLPIAIDMMLTGRTIKARRAREIALIDELLDPQEIGELNVDATLNCLEEAAVQTALRLSTKKTNASRSSSWWKYCTNYILSYPFIWQIMVRNPAIAQIRNKNSDNYPAPFAILNSIEAGFLQGPAMGFEVESMEFGRLCMTNVSKALIGLFHASTECKKQRYGEAKDISQLAVIGASEIGIGCINATVNKDIKVILVEEDEILRISCMQRIQDYWNNAVQNGKVTKEMREATRKNILICESISEINEADVVIIAADASSSKEKLFQEISKTESLVPPETPIVVQSFGRPLKDLTEGASHPERILAAIYTAPVERTEYAELVIHAGTNRKAVATAAALAVKQKKHIVVTKESVSFPGYYLIHCLLAALFEICEQIADGYLNCASEIDKFTEKVGFVIGLADLTDSVGILAIVEACRRWEDSGLTKKIELLEKMMESGRTGKAEGRGFYIYVNGMKVVGSRDDEFDNIVKDVRKNRVLSRTRLTEEERASRLLMSVAKAAVSCYERKLIQSPGEGDVSCVLGMGFPPYLGGPFNFIKLKQDEFRATLTGETSDCKL